MPAVRLYGSMLRRQVLYLFPFCFIGRCVCDSLSAEHLVDITTKQRWRRQGAEKPGGLSHKFVNLHQTVSQSASFRTK